MKDFQIRCIEPVKCPDVTENEIKRALLLHFGYKFNIKELTQPKPELPEEVPYHIGKDGRPPYYNSFDIAHTLNALLKYLKSRGI